MAKGSSMNPFSGLSTKVGLASSWAATGAERRSSSSASDPRPTLTERMCGGGARLSNSRSGPSSVAAAQHAAERALTLAHQRRLEEVLAGTAARPDPHRGQAFGVGEAAIERLAGRGLGLAQRAAAVQVVGGAAVRRADPLRRGAGQGQE